MMSMDGFSVIRARGPRLGQDTLSLLRPLPSIGRVVAYTIVIGAGLAIGLVLGLIAALSSGLIALC